MRNHLTGLTRKRGETGLIVAVHPGRAGSTVLGSMLNQHPDIRWSREIFSVQHSERLPRDAAGRILWRDHIEALRQDCPKPLLGIEIKFHQIIGNKKIFGEDLETAFAKLAEAFDPELVLLTRANHLERWLSGAVARENKLFHYRDGETAPQSRLAIPRVINDRGYGLAKMEINSWLDRVAEVDERFVAEATRRGGLLLTYEEAVQQDPAVAYRRVLEHLGLPLARSEPLYAKVDRRPLSERLSNYHELRDLLRPEHHRRYCGEDPAAR